MSEAPVFSMEGIVFFRGKVIIFMLISKLLFRFEKSIERKQSFSGLCVEKVLKVIVH